MKAFGLLFLLTLVWLDVPDRWRAELAGPKPAIVSSYSDRGRWKPQWEVEIKTEAGSTLTNSDTWTYRYYSVGERTEYTRAKHVYVGGFFLRWSIYFVVFPLLLGLLVDGIITLFRRRPE